MKVKILILSVGLTCCFFSAVQCWKAFPGNKVFEEDFSSMKSEGDAMEPNFYDNISTGPEKLPIAIFQLERKNLEEGEIKKSSESEVDEETIRKAEKMADKDLLNGLKRIFKNNETLNDVFRAENVYEIP